MKLAQRSYADTAVLSPVGRLDQDSAETFRAQLQPFVEMARDGRCVVLDLSALEYVSSAGLRCFMLSGTQAAAQGGTLLIAAMLQLVAEIFQISRFHLLFEIHPTVRAALAATSEQAAAAFDRG